MRAERTTTTAVWQSSASGNALAAPANAAHVPIVSLPLRLTFWLSLISALLAGAMHAATYFGRAPYSVLLLLPGLFVVWPLVLWQWRRVPRRNLASPIFGDVPRWMKWTIVALLLYAFVNFFIGRSLNDGGNPERRSNGTFVLASGSTVVRTLTLEEFRAAQAVQVRVVSGFFLCTFALAALLAEACWIKNGPAMANARID